MVDQVELLERVALAMAKVIAERHGHQNAEDWLSDQRREEARAALEASHHAELVEALQVAANKFWEYVILHQGKHTAEGDAKAASNQEMAESCEAALAKARTPTTPERSDDE